MKEETFKKAKTIKEDIAYLEGRKYTLLNCNLIQLFDDRNDLIEFSGLPTRKEFSDVSGAITANNELIESEFQELEETEALIFIDRLIQVYDAQIAKLKSEFESL